MLIPFEHYRSPSQNLIGFGGFDKYRIEPKLLEQNNVYING